MSERTRACEAPGIRMTFDSAAVRATKGKIMKPFNEITHDAGFDWARDHQDVVIVDRHPPAQPPRTGPPATRDCQSRLF